MPGSLLQKAVHAMKAPFSGHRLRHANTRCTPAKIVAPWLDPLAMPLLAPFWHWHGHKQYGRPVDRCKSSHSMQLHEALIMKDIAPRPLLATLLAFMFTTATIVDLHDYDITDICRKATEKPSRNYEPCLWHEEDARDILFNIWHSLPLSNDMKLLCKSYCENYSCMLHCISNSTKYHP